MKIAINGFGRIGRTVLRQLLTTQAQDPIEIALINDIASAEVCAYLFAFDSTFGPFPDPVAVAGGVLTVGDRRIRLTHAADVSDLDLSGVDVVMECTGHADTRAVAARGLAAGAARILISGPSVAADETIVLGANDDRLGDQAIISNASCTTNALAPVLRHIDGAFGLVAGHMTTIHCYTSSQPMVDTPRASLERSRAGAMSMVPTTTSAARLVGEVLPELAGKVTSSAVRVPVASVSAVDLTATLDQPTDTAALIACLAEMDPLIVGHTDLPLVSSDLRARPESLIVASRETFCVTPRNIRVFGWYDNEWGFSARMIDMALRMG